MVSCEFEQPHDRLACLTLRQLRLQLLPGSAVGLTGKQRVAKRKPPERLRLALPSIDEVTIIQRVAVVGGTGTSGGAVHRRTGQVTVEPVTIAPNLQPVPDQ